MTQDEAIDLIADNLPYQAAAELIECMQPSIRIHTSRCEKDSKSISKFGGDAYLPPQTPWPQWDPSASLRGQMERLQTLFGGRPDFLESKTGKPFQEEIRRLEEEIARGRAPLTFLGQIVLSDLPSVSAVGLPERGVLLFFYDVKSSPWGFDPRDGGSAQVLYLPDESVHRELRSKPDSIASIEIAPTALRFTQEWTIPDGLGQNDQDSLAGEPSKKVAYEQFLRELYGEEETVHRIRGYPQPIQGDMHLQIQLVTNGVFCGDQSGYSDPRRAELEPGALDWRLLMQLDSDQDGPGWIWGDMGRLYFWIHRADLDERNFGRVWCCLQCH